MAALLQFAPVYGVLTTAETIARLNHVVHLTMHRQASARPTLVCQWTQDADGRLSCHWDIVPADIPVPPH